jgi:hypothetical protein
VCSLNTVQGSSSRNEGGGIKCVKGPGVLLSYKYVSTTTGTSLFSCVGVFQCCGTVTIYYGSGSGSDF